MGRGILLWLPGVPHTAAERAASDTGGPGPVLACACRLGLGGLVGKRRDSPYVSRRSPDWIKLKCMQRQEFVIAGYTDPRGSREVLGSLLLGVHDDDGLLQYAGDVGTGFDVATLRALRHELARIRATRSPFARATVVRGRPHWLRPRLVAEVSFTGWTRAGHVRQAVFHGLRIDKSADSIRRERALPVSKEPRSRTAAANAPREPRRSAQPVSRPLIVTHGDRVIDTTSGITKRELVSYYAEVGRLMMEHLRGRPVSLVRAPQGVAGPHFYQKHIGTQRLAGVIRLDRALSPGHPPWLAIENERGLQSAAQWNVVEFHTHNGLADAFDNPDRIVFDLDPGAGLSWGRVLEGAQLVHDFLDELGLGSFPKTSGGKGLHVVVPVRTTLGWDAVKAFARAVVAHLARTVPERFVAKAGPGNRVRKIFVDYLRNSRDATTVCAWSARARAGMGISVPFSWQELPSLRSSAQWTVRNVAPRLEVGNAPWRDYRKSAQDLTDAMRALSSMPPGSR